MKDISVNLIWKDGMSFIGEVDNHKIVLDADKEFGGNDEGPRPKKLLLLSLAGCTAMDVISLLNKMRVKYTSFEVKVNSALTEEHPKVFTHFEIVYTVKGSTPESLTQINKAVSLSMEKYCGVSAMLSKVGTISHRIELQ